ncbi:MAG TPA: hypothetical protein VI685_12015 [Candidatus Angelobacter sp.]
MRTRRFHLTVRSALAAFLLMGGLQAVMLSAREPLGSGAIAVVNWFIGKIRPDSFKLSEPAISWTFFWAEMAIGLSLLLLSLGFAAGVGRSKRTS